MAIASPGVTLINARDQLPTLTANGSATSAAGGAVIATFPAVVVAGNYELQTSTVVGTAVAIADANNVGVFVNGNQKAATPVTPILLNSSPIMPMVFGLNIGDVVTLRAIGAATSTSVYNVTGVLRQVS